MITAEQCRAARALLNWTQADLADRVSVSAVSIRAFEKGGDMRHSNRKLIRLAFEAAGVVFIPENGGGAGVRLANARGADDLSPQQPTDGEQGIIKTSKM